MSLRSAPDVGSAARTLSPVRARALCVLGLALLAWASCDFSGGQLDGFVLRLKYSPAEALVAGQVLDASTGELLDDVVVELRVVGPDAGRVIDLLAHPLTELAVQTGTFSFGIRGEGTAEQPVDVRLEARADSFGILNFVPGLHFALYREGRLIKTVRCSTTSSDCATSRAAGPTPSASSGFEEDEGLMGRS